MSICCMYYRVPFYTIKTFKQKQKYRISSPRPDREQIFIRFRLGNKLCLWCFCVLCFLEAVYLLFCCYMCLFDCKCRSLKRLGENIKYNRFKRTKENKHISKNMLLKKRKEQKITKTEKRKASIK